MKNIIKKINFLSLYSTGEFESWLSDMAKKGLLLEKISLLECTFLKRDPSDREYRIVFSDKPMNLDKIKIYKDSGWKFICSYKNINVFSSLSSEKMIEMPMDEKGQILSRNIWGIIYLCSTIFLLTIILSILCHNILVTGNTPHINFYNAIR